MENKNSETPIIILSGGYGIFIDDSGERQAKANILVQGKPLIYFVILSYLQHGFRDFYVSGSYQIESTERLLKTAFNSNFAYKNQKFSLKFFDTGLHTKTGHRVSKVFEHLPDSGHIGVTYSDTLTLMPIGDEFKYHKDSNCLGTIAGVRLPSRFLVIGTRPGENIVRGFSQKHLFKGDYINGGYYFFKKSFLNNEIWDKKENLVLETDVLNYLISNSQLSSFMFEGDWQHTDCERDLVNLIPICKAISEDPIG